MCAFRTRRGLTLLCDDLAFKEVQEVRPVGAGFVAAVVLAVGQTSIHKAVVHAREQVCAYTLVT